MIPVLLIPNLGKKLDKIDALGEGFNDKDFTSPLSLELRLFSLIFGKKIDEVSFLNLKNNSSIFIYFHHVIINNISTHCCKNIK